MERAKNIGKLPAFAAIGVSANGTKWKQQGMDMRQYYAGLAMQGMLSDVNVQYWLQEDPRYYGNNFAEVVAKNSVEFADALIKELSKPQP